MHFLFICFLFSLPFTLSGLCYACRWPRIQLACFHRYMTRKSTGMCVCSSLVYDIIVGQVMTAQFRILTLWLSIKGFISYPAMFHYTVAYLSCFLCCCLVLLIYVFPLQGTHMYAQLPPEASEHLKDVLEEGKVSLMKFMCNQLESSFRTVESPYMIQFTRYSTAVPQPGLEDAYPYCTYNLLPFPGIPRPTSNTPRFLG